METENTPANPIILAHVKMVWDDLTDTEKLQLSMAASLPPYYIPSHLKEKVSVLASTTNEDGLHRETAKAILVLATWRHKDNGRM